MLNDVTFRHVSMIRQGKSILHDINVGFRKNQLTTLVGPNGGGKSSLLKLILGIEKPSNGEIYIRKGLKIGYMPQKLSIDSTLPITVKRFLKNTDILKQVDAIHLENLNMSTLSGGEMQRVLLAYALQDEPDLLLLDEPTQGLDIYGEQQIYQLIFDYQKKSKCCIIMSSHDLNFVLAKSDNVLCLNGHICCQGHPDNVKDADIFTKVPYEHQHNHIHTLSGGVCKCLK